MKAYLLTLLTCCLLYMPRLAGQDSARVDSAILPTDPPRSFSLVFNRGFMLSGSQPDSVPLNGTGSGTYFIGAGFRFSLFKNKMGLRVSPGIAFTHFTYEQTNLKTFPSVPDSVPFPFTQERHGSTWAELPLGIYANFSRDEDGDPRFFAELGGYIGYLLAANYKTRYNNAANLRVKEKVRDLHKIESEWERLRYGLYGRVGYKWAAIYVSYRLSEVFDEFTNPAYRPKAVEGFRNPAIAPMEFGITVFL